MDARQVALSDIPDPQAMPGLMTGPSWRSRLATPVTINGDFNSFTRVPKEAFATLFPGAAEIAATLAYFEAHTYLGSESKDWIALANTVAGTQPTDFSTWARLHFPVQTA